MKLNKEKLDVFNELRASGGGEFIGRIACKLNMSCEAVKEILVRLEEYGLIYKDESTGSSTKTRVRTGRSSTNVECQTHSVESFSSS